MIQIDFQHQRLAIGTKGTAKHVFSFDVLLPPQNARDFVFDRWFSLDVKTINGVRLTNSVVNHPLNILYRYLIGNDRASVLGTSL